MALQGYDSKAIAMLVQAALSVLVLVAAAGCDIDEKPAIAWQGQDCGERNRIGTLAVALAVAVAEVAVAAAAAAAAVMHSVGDSRPLHMGTYANDGSGSFESAAVADDQVVADTDRDSDPIAAASLTMDGSAWVASSRQPILP